MLEWLQLNYQWFAIFIVAIVAAILAWLQYRKKEPPQIAMQDAAVQNAAIAAGAGINQNVNAPVINVNIAQPAPIPTAAPEPRAVALPAQPIAPNIIVTVIQITGVSQATHGVWTENHPVLDAFIIRFTNEARAGRQNVGGTVKARLIYRDGLRELRRITGSWLDQGTDRVQFHVDESHTLLVGYMQGDQFTTVGKRRVVIDMNTVEFPTDTNILNGFETGTVSVCLTHADRGAVLYEGQFFLNTHPPEIRRELA